MCLQDGGHAYLTRKPGERNTEESKASSRAADSHLGLVPFFEELFNLQVDNLALDILDRIVLKVPRDDLFGLVEDALPFPPFQTSPFGLLRRRS